MIAAKILLIIIAAIAFLLLFALFVPIGLDFRLVDWENTKVNVIKFKLWFLKFKLYPKTDAQKQKKTEKKQKKKKTQKSKDKSQNSRPKLTYEDILSLVKSALKNLRKQTKHIKIDRLRINARIGGEDSFESALNYPKIAGAAVILIAFFEDFFDLNIKKVEINPDFLIEKNYYKISGQLTSRLIWLFIVAFRIYIEYNSLYKDKKGGNKNESRQTDQRAD